MPTPALRAWNSSIEEPEWVEDPFGHLPETERLPELERQFVLLRQQLQLGLQHVHARLEVLEAQTALGAHACKVHPGDGAKVDQEILPPELPTLNEGSPNAGALNQPAEVLDIHLSEAGVKSTRSRTPKVQEFTEVSFEESAWSIPLLAGLIDISIFETMFAATLVLLNLGMQTAFSIILLTPAFMGEDFESKVDGAKAWRTGVAHDSRYMDLAGTSLVTRVCNGDGSVILSTVQATLVEHVNSFLGMDKAQFDLPAFQPGVLLCMLCIVLWTLCVNKEFRQIWVQLEAAFGIPKAQCTSFGDNAFTTISWGRFGLLLLTYACRTAIASVLLVAGILWLSRTTSISELMLNAVALNAILDVDEFLFVGMTPIKIQQAIQNLEPMKAKYSRRRSECESMVHFSSLLALVLVTYLLLLGPLTDDMLSLKQELCGGDQAFVIGFNADTQITHALVTPNAWEIAGRNLTLSELAVEAHKATSPETTPGPGRTLIIASTDKSGFEADTSRGIDEEGARIPFCIEPLILNEDGPYHNDTVMRRWTSALLRTSAASVGLHDARSCRELRGMCDAVESRLLRLVCGETCGCTDPYSNSWFKVPVQGCTPACLGVAESTLSAQGACQDVPNDDTWQSFWRTYPDAVSYFYSTDVTTLLLWAAANQTIQAMLQDGCGALVRFPTDPLTDANWCAGMPQLFRPLAKVCPQSCGCDQASELPSFCPSTCLMSGNSSSAS
ncbi:unnamed protein product [Symbiodinium natans]|uniref:Uncharacterized protein n=1 Tax=Symbiodinium natans TaxID=878477 RepID=A0A812Q5J5_9DINO|nr:unnamed protein product [Symbiodinium natans]